MGRNAPFALAVLVGGYAWQIHGFWVGVFALLSLCIIMGLSNLVVLYAASSSENPLRWIRIVSWGWPIAALLMIAITGAAIGTV
jgi:amino acid permease